MKNGAGFSGLLRAGSAQIPASGIIRFDGKPPKGRFGIAVSKYHADITGPMLAACVRRLVASGVRPRDITVVYAPGAFELPAAARAMAKRCCAVIALGCVIKGDTKHDEYIAGAVADGIGRIPAETGVPAAFGVLTTLNKAQAVARSGPGRGNKGAEAAQAALEMARIMELLKRSAA